MPVFKDVAYGVVDLICENDGQFVFGKKNRLCKLITNIYSYTLNYFSVETQKPEFMACLGTLRESVTECKISNVTKSISLIYYGEEQCR